MTPGAMRRRARAVASSPSSPRYGVPESKRSRTLKLNAPIGVGTISLRQRSNFLRAGQAGGVVNPGYVTAPNAVNYYFTDRDAFRARSAPSTW